MAKKSSLSLSLSLSLLGLKCHVHVTALSGRGGKYDRGRREETDIREKTLSLSLTAERNTQGITASASVHLSVRTLHKHVNLCGSLSPSLSLSFEGRREGGKAQRWTDRWRAAVPGIAFGARFRKVSKNIKNLVLNDLKIVAMSFTPFRHAIISRDGGPA